MTNNEIKSILGVKVNKIATEKVLEKIKSFLLSDGQRYIVTLNPEMAVEAQENGYFKKIINEADIVIPDGVGILWALDFLEKKKNNLFLFVYSLFKLLFVPKHRRDVLKHRTQGVDLIYKICESDFIESKKVYLLGAEKGIAKKTAKVLSQKYDYLNIIGAEEGIWFEITNYKLQIPNKCKNKKCHPELVSGSVRIIGLSYLKILKQAIKRIEKIYDHRQKILKQVQNDNKMRMSSDDLIQRINKVKPDILLVAFGAPKQEKWIYENLKKMPSVKLAIGVGGSFDFISGKIKRTPLIFQRVGLEWLWRLMLEPWRFRRIYNATVKFGRLVWKEKGKKEKTKSYIISFL